jgi:thiol:disulfide interchange protein
MNLVIETFLDICRSILRWNNSRSFFWLVMLAIPLFLAVAGYKLREIHTLQLWIFALVAVAGLVILTNWLVHRRKKRH